MSGTCDVASCVQQVGPSQALHAGAAPPPPPQGEDAVGWRVGLRCGANTDPEPNAERTAQRWAYGVVSEYDAGAARFRVKMDSGESRASEALSATGHTDWVQPGAGELSKAARLAVAGGGAPLARSRATEEDVAAGVAALARGVLGAAPPHRLQDAAAAPRAQLAAMLPWLAGSGLGCGAAAELPAELAGAEGPEELAAALRAMTGEAGTAPALGARPSAKPPRRRARTAEQRFPGLVSGAASKARWQKTMICPLICLVRHLHAGQSLLGTAGSTL